MTITIGFIHSSQNLTIHRDESQEDVTEQVNAALQSPGSTFNLTDSKGNTYVLRTDAIAYVEVGSPRSFPVGFKH